MKQAYLNLFGQGAAHSVEVWDEKTLVGGLYGIGIGKVFFGESMFSIRSNASKIALLSLCEKLIAWNYELIDCQVYSEHMISLGAEEIPRSQFCNILEELCSAKSSADSWQIDDKIL
jgi:leucyl/phenylalanyl-tRNA--protein transferase